MEIVITTPEDLKEALKAAIREMGLWSPSPVPSAQHSEKMRINEVVDYLNKRSYVTTKSSLYNKVASNSIPYQKINNKLIFEQKAVDRWLEKELEVVG